MKCGTKPSWPPPEFPFHFLPVRVRGRGQHIRRQLPRCGEYTQRKEGLSVRRKSSIIPSLKSDYRNTSLKNVIVNFLRQCTLYSTDHIFSFYTCKNLVSLPSSLLWDRDGWFHRTRLRLTYSAHQSGEPVLQL